MATYPATMAARAAVPIIRVAIIMGSPPLVVLLRGEQEKNGANRSRPEKCREGNIDTICSSMTP
jgi:hypothetical protein